MSNPIHEIPLIFRLRLQKTRVGRGIPGPRACAKSSRGSASCAVCGGAGASLCESANGTKLFHGEGRRYNLVDSDALGGLQLTGPVGKFAQAWLNVSSAAFRPAVRSPTQIDEKTPFLPTSLMNAESRSANCA